jgi:hypothetical protein
VPRQPEYLTPTELVADFLMAEGPFIRGAPPVDIVASPERGRGLMESPKKPIVREPGGAARVQITSPAHGEISFFGLLQPARLVHITNADGVVAANNCTLLHRDHYHLDVVHVALDRSFTTPGHRFSLFKIFTSPNIHDTLADLVRDPDSPGRDRAFCRALAAAIDDKAEPTATSVPLASTHATVISGAALVQLGDSSSAEVNNNYVVQETTLPGGELLLEDENLRAAFINAIREGPDGPATETFLTGMLEAGGCMDKLNLLRNITDLPERRTRLFSLFGYCRVDDATSVMIGEGNRLTTDTNVDPGRFADGGIIDAIALLHDELVATPPPDSAVLTDSTDPHAPYSPEEPQQPRRVAEGQPGTPPAISTPATTTFDLQHEEEERRRRREGRTGQ